jgi:hypothetical protein
VALLVLFGGNVAAPAQPVVSGVATASSADAPSDSVVFRFERVGLPVPRYSITLWNSGAGKYEGEELPAAASSSAPAAARPFVADHFAISRTTMERVFALARALQRFQMECAAKAKNVASSGAKTLTYHAAAGVESTCAYDYSENKDVQALTAIFEGITETMDEGRLLDYLHRYDRLGLDAATEFLAKEIAAGHALEVGTIAGTLQMIADDPAVLQRVRARVTEMLAPGGTAHRGR